MFIDLVKKLKDKDYVFADAWGLEIKPDGIIKVKNIQQYVSGTYAGRCRNR